MKTLYLDAFSGISGDMFIGALLDLGIDFEHFQAELTKLHVHGYQLEKRRLAKNSIYGTSFDVVLNHEKDRGFVESAAHHHDVRHLDDIRTLIASSDLSDKIKKQSIDVFTEIARAEAVVHQLPVEEVHFHEVGALDSIVDIVGSFIALDLLGVDEVRASELSDGSGFIQVAHGQMPVPVPAVMQMRVGTHIPIRQRTDIRTELITPTGMGLVKEMVAAFGPVPEHDLLLKTGYGFGKRETGTFNALRALLFETKKSGQTVRTDHDSVLLIEANLDDQSGESLAFAMDQLIEAGALDVFFTPIYMKKNRPSCKLSVLCIPEEREVFVDLLLKHTSTIGVRYQLMQRSIMKRCFKTIDTKFGAIRIKVARSGSVVRETAEYDDCAQAARRHRVSLSEVEREVQRQLILTENQ
ncbi:nickel pincer cofactor biosynthesis protein LarC [Sporolactobacillus sp. CPB3-1]|uniref:Pyridinium-3,5-bisthiocarboxylic acid mononucleotide nickel insertion protein n=1 Tax=Sporolactobacillus mangiferae TaxID=2940498 RepID=A0ABT0MDP9_9BACL|nr:nickel pincer cofactor biosynthesis protein LarC [Sporolactobacillus mangiferae]MCL1632994.1 nickel pincer cofactor biosynthesis protein LarC [Sporolactobacillus mangiferae]